MVNDDTLRICIPYITKIKQSHNGTRRTNKTCRKSICYSRGIYDIGRITKQRELYFIWRSRHVLQQRREPEVLLKRMGDEGRLDPRPVIRAHQTPCGVEAVEGRLGLSRGADHIVRGRLNRGLFKDEAAFVTFLFWKLL